MREEAQRQIDLLLQQQEQLAPELYRDLALYLQVLREGLLHAVQQACFHLATQVVPERYNQLPAQRRQAFQARLQELVQRTSSLLTVEQINLALSLLAHRDQAACMAATSAAKSIFSTSMPSPRLKRTKRRTWMFSPTLPATCFTISSTVRLLSLM